MFELDEGNVKPLLTIGKALYFKDETKDNTINTFINNTPSITYLTS